MIMRRFTDLCRAITFGADMHSFTLSPRGHRSDSMKKLLHIQLRFLRVKLLLAILNSLYDFISDQSHR